MAIKKQYARIEKNRERLGNIFEIFTRILRTVLRFMVLLDRLTLVPVRRTITSGSFRISKERGPNQEKSIFTNKTQVANHVKVVRH
jgi:hypothetical protein